MHLSSSLSDAVGVKDVTDAVTEQIMPVLNAQALALVVADNGRLRVLGTGGFRRAAQRHFDGLSLSSNVPSIRVLATGVPEFFPDSGELLRAHPQGASVYAQQASFAYLPLIAAGRPIGCCVLGYSETHAFPADERAALTALAAMIAQALERASLYDTKNQVAYGLQAALLPRLLPAVPGLDSAARYLPASQGMDIGGDFYDLVRLDETTAAAVIGDVQGHNVNAAALMGQVRTAVHTHADSGAGPGEVLARANRLLVDLQSQLFASCLYVQLDLRNGKALLASAGHPPPLLRHPDHRAEVLDPPPDCSSASNPTPTTRPPRSRCPPAPSWRCTPTAWSKDPASTSASPSPTSPANWPPRRPRPWTRSPTPSSTTSSRRAASATTWPSCCSARPPPRPAGPPADPDAGGAAPSSRRPPHP